MDTRYFKVRDHIRERKLRVNFLRTHQNVSDFFTKALANPLFADFKQIIMGMRSAGF